MTSLFSGILEGIDTSAFFISCHPVSEFWHRAKARRAAKRRGVMPKSTTGLPKEPKSATIKEMLTKRKKERVIKEAQLHSKDTGSPEVQISILSKSIDELATHLKKNPKDKHSRRGLLQMVADRRTHLMYLKKKGGKRYATAMKKLEA